MSRLTISLPDEIHQALREAAARRGTAIGSIVAESLVAYGIKTRASALELVRRAQAQAGLDEERATSLAVAETRADRNSRSRSQGAAHE